MSTKDEQRKIAADPLTAKLVNAAHIIRSNKIAAKRISLVLLVLAAVLVVFAAKSAQKEAAALYELNRLSILMHADLKSNANSIDSGLDKLIKSYSGTDAALKASYYRAIIKYEVKNYKDAFAFFKKASTLGKDNVIHAAALLGMGNAAEQLKQWQTAYNAYSKLADENNSHGFKAAAMLGQARIKIVMKQFPEAVRILEKLKEERTLFARKAEKLLTYLKLGTKIK